MHLHSGTKKLNFHFTGKFVSLVSPTVTITVRLTATVRNGSFYNPLIIGKNLKKKNSKNVHNFFKAFFTVVKCAGGLPNNNGTNRFSQ